MKEKNFGDRNDKGSYIPKKRVSYPPVFVWPLAPIKSLKWVFSIPGYFLPWNLFYVGIGLISWFILSPPLEDYADIKIITFLTVFIKNSCLVSIFYGAFHYRLYIQRAQDIDFKYNPRWPEKNSKQFLFGNQNKDNIFLTFCSGVLIWTCFENSILWFAANGFLRLVSLNENLVYIITMILLIHLWRDLHFYLIHFEPLYKLAHKTHHRNVNPGPWSGLAMHPIEHTFYFSCALLYLFFPFHPAFVIVTLVHAGLSPAPGHAGFERIKSAERLSFDLDSYAHYLHHKYFECNYADGILPLDRWFGTLHDGSEESLNKMRNRLSKKNQKKISSKT
jgi:sterol desaturase/sphingolipid hydroxylase (fatty acid hydroxylase superfamily)